MEIDRLRGREIGGCILIQIIGNVVILLSILLPLCFRCVYNVYNRWHYDKRYILLMRTIFTTFYVSCFLLFYSL